MKKTVSLVVLLLLVLPALFGVLAGCTSYDEKLIVYNWEDYIDIDLLDEFCEYYEETTGSSLKIVYSTFDTNETMLANVMKGGAEVDLICPSEYAVQKLHDNGFLRPFQKKDNENFTNLDNLNSLFEEQLDEIFYSNGELDRLFDYVVPYMWGTLGLLYNSEVISDEEAEQAGWGLLWNQTEIEGVNGTILMKDSIRDVYVATLMYAMEIGLLGEPYTSMDRQSLINTVNPELLQITEQLLIKQRPFLKGYEVDLGKEDMKAGKAMVNLAWSGDALYAMSEDDRLNYIVPNNEGNVWFDAWVMPKSAKNVRAAEMFVNFLCTPDSAIRNMMYIGYTSAVDAEVFEALPDFVADGSQFSKSDVLNVLNETEYGYVDYTKVVNGEEEVLSALWIDLFGEELDYSVAVTEDDIVQALNDYETDGYRYSADNIVEWETPWGEFFDSEIQYPTDFTNMGVMKDFGAQQPTIVAMWERVKSESDENDNVIAICLIVIFGAAAAIGLGIVGYRIYDKKFPKRKYLSEDDET